MKARSLSTAVALALLVASSGASALAPTEAIALVPFNFSNPGARSLGMGGAFLGAADDATAALVNPAGLTRLGLEQQFSVEYRNYGREVPYAQEGFVNINPYDNSNVLYRNSSADNDEISYLSWVLPRDNWAVSLYRHQMVNFQGGHRSSFIPFTGGASVGIRSVISNTDLEVVTYGASFAWNATENISVGAGLSWNDFELRSSLLRIDYDGTPRVSQQARGDDDDIGYNVGILFRGSDNVSFGVSYRSAPEFRYAYTSDFSTPGSTEVLRTADGTTPFKSPDVFGIGVSWRATDQLMFNLDVNRVGYSNITEDLDDPFFTGEFAVNSDPQILRSIRIEDTIEPRLGVEYAFASETPIFLRGGVWREKRHTLEFAADPESPNFSNPAEAIATATLYAAGSDETHVSLGFGVLFQSFQLDFAYDRSDRLDTLSMSGVYRF